MLSENTFAGHWEDYIENMVKGKHQINLTMELPQNTMNQSEHMALLRLASQRRSARWKCLETGEMTKPL